MMKQYLPLSLSLLLFQPSPAQTISVTVDPSKEIRTISPYIYGINNNVSDDPTKPTSAANWKKFNDAGVQIYRENGGNNSTKYNWKRKLTSHPDWYNNVYSHDWDYAAASILEKTDAQAFFGLQLLGKVASNKNNNFNDWDYNQSQWWNGTTNNWAGGGGPSGDGNSDLYLMDWPADSTAAILDHWLNNLQYDPNRIKYWNMDNEPEIWQNTHDDVTAVTAQEYVQRYIAVAKAARKNFPDIKLVGPASPNEWQWYTWNNVKVKDTDNKDYPWMEYFIKKIAEEQKASGVRLLDVLDVHFYPNTKSNPDLTLQLHRVWFDKSWDYSGANGVKVTGPTGWDNSITKEYFFERCNAWLTKYIGADHGVSFGISEYGAIGDNNTDPNIISCWYASHLGTFAANNVELFTPWDWYKGQWEVMHLFSNYYGKISTEATSANEQLVSAYSSVSQDKDSLMVVVVNRDRTNARNVDLSISNFTGTASVVSGFQLANLPSTETFISESNNALEKNEYTLTGNKLSFSAPSLSVTLFQIPLSEGTAVRKSKSGDLTVYPNPSHQENALRLVSDKNQEVNLTVKDMSGRIIFSKDHVKTNEELNIDQSLPPGLYMMELENEGFRSVIKLVRN